MMSANYNMQLTFIDIFSYNFTASTLVDLTNQTVTGWENNDNCTRKNISENITIGEIIDVIKYNTSYEGLQRVSWDGGRNFYHVLGVNNQSFIYYDRYTTEVKYIYQPDEGMFVDMGYGFQSANFTRGDFDLGYKCAYLNNNYTLSLETERTAQLVGFSGSIRPFSRKAQSEEVILLDHQFSFLE